MSADSVTSSARPGGMRRLDDPTDLSWADYKTALLATKDEIGRDDVSSMAAGVAFKIFLALFPSLLAAVAILGLVMEPTQLNDYVARLAGVVPSEALGIVRSGLENITRTSARAAGGLAITGVLGGLWAATSAAASVVRALNRAYEIEESRNAVKQRLIALGITAGLLLAIAALVLLVIAGPQVQSAVVPAQLQGPIANVVFGAIQVVAVVGILIVLFAFVYWVGPNRDRPQWQWISPGAVVGVIGWLVVSLAFTVYVQNFGRYEKTYGGIGGVIVLLLWLQLSMTLMLIGAEFNAEVERVRARHDAVRAGVGMGLLGDSPAVVDASDAALVAPTPHLGPRPLPSGAAPAPAKQPPPAAQQTRQPRGAGGNRALLAGVAAALAAAAAVVGAIRSRG